MFLLKPKPHIPDRPVLKSVILLFEIRLLMRTLYVVGAKLLLNLPAPVQLQILTG